MTVPTTTLTDTAAVDRSPAEPQAGDEETCAACAHPLTAHDPIGLRFCRATTAGGLSRGCVCRTS
jgi:hypothetical protein